MSESDTGDTQDENSILITSPPEMPLVSAAYSDDCHTTDWMIDTIKDRTRRRAMRRTASKLTRSWDAIQV